MIRNGFVKAVLIFYLKALIKHTIITYCRTDIQYIDNDTKKAGTHFCFLQNFL